MKKLLVVFILITIFFALSDISFAAVEYNDESSKQQYNLLYAIGSMLGLTGENDVDTPNPTSPQTTPNPNSAVPTNNPSGPQVNQSFVALKELYKYVGDKVGVPTCIIEGVSYIEYPTVYKYSKEQINQYSQPSQVIPNCPWNYCSAAGHMQMTMGVDERGDTKCTRCGHGYCPDAWKDNSQGQAVLKYEGGNHTPNVCNLRDSTFAAAQKLKNDSGTAPGDMNWSVAKMIKVGGNYYGSSTLRYEWLGNRTYGEYLAYNCSL